ncbi:MAG: xanthine dehydrogenase family protein molybdopterin-binding subunit [Wenzhouxiangellaceae bacterium]
MSQSTTTSVRTIKRRDFLKTTGLSGGGLVLALHIPGGHLLAEMQSAEAAFEPSVYLRIATDGTVEIICHRSEMGQGIRTGLPAVVADELEADWERVKIVQALGDPKYGSQNTDGSRSLRRFYQTMREAGATARHLLTQAAAQRWGVPLDECQANQSVVTHAASGRQLNYGELAAAAAELPAPEAGVIKLKDKADWRYIGKSLPIVDLDDMLTGKAVYGGDIRLPNMLFASIERPPTVFGKALSVDSSDAKESPGVVDVVQLAPPQAPVAFQPLGGVAVVAESTFAAIRGRRALKIDWEHSEHGSYDSAAFREAMRKTAHQEGKTIRSQGDFAAAESQAAKVIEADYYVPHHAQAPMEPPVATAKVEGDHCEVWSATQTPQATRSTVAAALGIPAENVKVHVTLLGGGFGRKSKPDYAVEAALLSRECGGRPVQVVWTREDDLKHGYFHAVSYQYMKGCLDESGRCSGWMARTVFSPIASTFAAGAEYAGDGEVRLGFTDLPYALSNLQMENGPAAAHLRIGWLRSVANIYHAFAHGSFVSELAAAAGRDEKDYLLEMLGPARILDIQNAGLQVEYDNYGDPLETYPIDIGRMRAVIERAADEAGWDKPLPDGHGRGIAVHRSFLTYVAIVAQVSTDKQGKLKIHRIDLAADCGRYVNPDRVHAQMEGAVMYALGMILRGELTAKDGVVQEDNFDRYRVARITDTPDEIYIHMMDNDHPPAGVGEPGVPPVAPAIANAIFHATGKRVRELPLSKAGLA